MVSVRTSPASVAHASKSRVAERRIPQGMGSIVTCARVFTDSFVGSQSWLPSWACGPPKGMKTHRSIVGQVGQPAADWESASRHAQRLFKRLRWAFDRAAGFQPALFRIARSRFPLQETFPP